MRCVQLQAKAIMDGGNVIRLHCLALAFLITLVAARAQGIRESTDCVDAPLGYETQCGYVTLPEDYAQPQGATIEIYYARIQSRGESPAPDPLVYLVGGPGSSGSQLMPISFRAYLRAFSDERDIIVIDQRGTGLSNPSLFCREAVYRLDEVLQSHHAEHAELLLDILRECHQRLSRADINFANYHSGANARDIVYVLLALGYERWNLVGVSYGSRLALAMMRDYPQYLRSVILDSVYPPQADIYLDAYYSGERALKVLFEACRASAGCDDRYPNLAGVFYGLYHRLNREPLTASYAPPRYKTLNIEISGYRLYDWVFSWLYDKKVIKLIPQLIMDLEEGRLEEPLRIGVAHEANLQSLNLGMHYTVQCQEEYISASFRDYASIVAAHPHLSGFLSYPVEGSATLPRLCEMWGARARPAIANSPVTSDVPALLLSGDFDPITPPAYADMAEKTLSVAYNYLFPQVGHGVLRSDQCAVKIALAFINQPLREPDSSCIAESEAIDFQ